MYLSAKAEILNPNHKFMHVSVCKISDCEDPPETLNPDLST